MSPVVVPYISYMPLVYEQRSGLDVDAMRIIHRHRDGAITFHRKNGENFENISGFQIEYLDELLPQIQEQLASDAYFSLNAFWCPGGRKYHLPAARLRKRNLLRYLCACFCDLDGYNQNLSSREILRMVKALEKSGQIPIISGYADSGRGLWVFWLLHNRDDSATAQRAFPEKIRLYEAIQAEIHKRLAHLGADAKDVLRIARIPGSTNSKSGTTVRYSFRGQQGNFSTYTLADLAVQLGVETKRASHDGPVRPQGKVPLRRRGYDALAERRLREFERLRAMRGCFKDGHRNNAALVYSWLLRCNRQTPQAAERRVIDLGQECRPALTPSECRSAVKSALKPQMRKFRDATISDYLDITPAESEMLEKLPPASRFDRLNPKPSPASVDRSAISERRREVISKTIRKLEHVPSTREMARLLSDAGHRVSHVSIAADYKKLGVRCES
jgi:hypothetical protein